MTIDELEKKLKEIDKTLFIDKSFDEPILSIKTVDENLIIYDFERKLFFRDGLQVFWDRNCNDTDNYFCTLQRLLADYQGEMKAQTISKDSKNENSSTAAFSKPASKDSQKKTKEQLIYDFVDEITDHNFKATQTMTLHKTSSISIKADEVGTPCLNIYLTGILDDRIPENPIQIKADDINEKSSSQLGWLLNRASKLVSDLRSM